MSLLRVVDMERQNMQVRILPETDMSELYGRKSSNVGTYTIYVCMHTLWYDELHSQKKINIGGNDDLRAMNVEDQKDSSDNILDEQDAMMRQDEDDKSQMQDNETNQSEV